MRFFSEGIRNRTPAPRTRVLAAIDKLLILTPIDIGIIYRALREKYSYPKSTESRRVYEILSQLDDSFTQSFYDIRREICLHLNENSGTATFNALLKEIERQFHPTGSIDSRTNLPAQASSYRDLIRRNISQADTPEIAVESALASIVGVFVINPLILTLTFPIALELFPLLTGFAMIASGCGYVFSYFSARIFTKGLFDTLTCAEPNKCRIMNVCEMLLIFLENDIHQLTKNILTHYKNVQPQSWNSRALTNELKDLNSTHNDALKKAKAILKYLTETENSEGLTLCNSGRNTYEIILSEVEKLYREFEPQRKYRCQLISEIQIQNRGNGTHLLTLKDMNTIQKLQLLLDSHDLDSALRFYIEPTTKALQVILSDATCELIFGKSSKPSDKPIISAQTPR